MKYYIARKDSTCLWRVVKRLSDFKPESGVEYVVKTNSKSIELGNSLPIYIGLDGKLKKTSSLAVYLF